MNQIKSKTTAPPSNKRYCLKDLIIFESLSKIKQ